MKRLITFLLVIMFLSLIASCAPYRRYGITQEVITPPSNDSSITLTPSPDPNFHTGETAIIGNWEITVDSFEVKDTIDMSAYTYYTPDEGNKYVVANMTIKNIGTEIDVFCPSFSISNKDVRVKIVYQNTYEYSASSLLGCDKELHDDSMNPLTKGSGFIAFSVVEEAITANELKLIFTCDDKIAIYNVSI